MKTSRSPYEQILSRFGKPTELVPNVVRVLQQLYAFHHKTLAADLKNALEYITPPEEKELAIAALSLYEENVISICENCQNPSLYLKALKFIRSPDRVKALSILTQKLVNNLDDVDIQVSIASALDMINFFSVEDARIQFVKLKPQEKAQITQIINQLYQNQEKRASALLAMPTCGNRESLGLLEADSQILNEPYLSSPTTGEGYLLFDEARKRAKDFLNRCLN